MLDEHRAALEELSRVNNEIVTLQRALARRAQEQAERTRRLEHFVAALSHDLGNLLTNANGFAELLLGDDTLSQQHRVFLERIHRAQRSMIDLNAELLQELRPEGRVLDAVRRRIDLRELLEHVVQTHEAQAMGRGQQLVLNAPSAEVPMNGNPDRLERLFGNLVSNALKFGPRDSRVTITVRLVGDQVIASVADQGKGVAVEERERVFEMFTRAEGADRAPGYGLGLYIVRQIAGAHGGSVHVESANPGACFVVTLPLSA